MTAIIDMQTVLLVDRSKVGDPRLRLLLKALGRELAKGSAWIAVNKEIATYHGLARRFVVRQDDAAAA